MGKLTEDLDKFKFVVSDPKREAFRTVHLIKNHDMIIEIKLPSSFTEWDSLNFVRDGINKLLDHVPDFKTMIKISELYDEDVGSV